MGCGEDDCCEENGAAHADLRVQGGGWATTPTSRQNGIDRLHEGIGYGAQERSVPRECGETDEHRGHDGDQLNFDAACEIEAGGRPPSRPAET